jgi:predicted  nucleic acid-binding Zn-ribbon protein
MEAEADMKEAKERADTLKKAADKAKKEKEQTYQTKNAISEYEEAKWHYEQKQSYYKMYKKSQKEVQGTIDAITEKMTKMDLYTSAQVEKKLKEYTAETMRLKKESEKLDKDFNLYVVEAKREIELSKKKVPPLSEQIENNVRSIMGNLRPMDEVEKEIIAERKKNVKKSFSVVSRRFMRIGA